MGLRISPSILSADFANLAESVAAVADVADWDHVDVMDNHIVPNLTQGLPVVEALLRATTLPLDCHLMIDEPDRWAPPYADAGAGSVTFHIEAAHDPVRLAREVRALGARVGMALKPGTAFAPYADLLPELDMVLVMTVEPGFGGQRFMADMLPKVREVRAALEGRDDLAVWLQVDGGVDESTAVACVEAGADTLVAGSAVFGATDPAEAVLRIKAAAERGHAPAAPR
ncbi:MAG: ribulose-phosphate 3-epimerase [Frankiaceae bacterium]|nr:ribulose-phosphate 3-epimerase [Frankiaceae bacterium]